jgi:ABC-type oligopeptide transport system substrate-binding subunit
MKRRSALPLTAAGATVLLAVAACSGSKPSPRQASGEYNAALNAAVNASSHKGGTIVFDYSTVPDSTDPGNTYHAEISDFAGVPDYVHQHRLGLVISGWPPDWPNGFGFLFYLTAGSVISPVANSNISELNDPAVNDMFTRALTTTSIAARTRIWSRIDRQVMADAAILPGVYAKALLYRNPHLTNVYVHQYYSMYDYASLGLK